MRRDLRALLVSTIVPESVGMLPPSNNPYGPDQDGWATFDALPTTIKRAHDVVFTDRPLYTNQYRERTYLCEISPEDAVAILELDGGQKLLASSDLVGYYKFDSRDRC